MCFVFDVWFSNLVGKGVWLVFGRLGLEYFLVFFLIIVKILDYCFIWC